MITSKKIAGPALTIRRRGNVFDGAPEQLAVTEQRPCRVIVSDDPAAARVGLELAALHHTIDDIAGRYPLELLKGGVALETSDLDQ